jgi:methylated-DNA-[protein]-cysteine S-methyltransferase
MSNATFFSTMSSPVGRLTLVGEGDDLVGLYFDKDPLAGKMRGDSARDDRRLRAAVEQLEEYFAGARRTFELSLVPPGTAFQRKVWATYGEIARAVGRPDASRAVGGANHRNPIAIIIPCHRVIGADGSMTGYGGGLPRKRLLLELEARTASSGQLGLPGAL